MLKGIVRIKILSGERPFVRKPFSSGNDRSNNYHQQHGKFDYCQKVTQEDASTPRHGMDEAGEKRNGYRNPTDGTICHLRIRCLEGPHCEAHTVASYVSEDDKNHSEHANGEQDSVLSVSRSPIYVLEL
jgi:hypothetical protein